MERQTLVFATERETKNTVRFQEEASGKPPVIGLCMCSAGRSENPCRSG